MNTVAEFSDRFRELIGDESFTKVGAAIGVSKQTISAYVKGDRSPKKPTIQVIALYYGVNPAWLIGLDVPKYIDKQTTESAHEPEPEEIHLIHLYRELNSEGRELLVDYADTLVTSEKYIKSSASELGKAQT